MLRQRAYCLRACCWESYRIVFPLVEADVSVEDFNEELHLQRRVHALVGNLQSLLETLHHSLTVTDLKRQDNNSTLPPLTSQAALPTILPYNSVTNIVLVE